MSQDILSPSRIALQAFGLDLVGTRTATESEAQSGCAMCGGPIHVGEPIDGMNMPKSFTNSAALANPGGRWRCGACTRVMEEKLFQMNFGSGVFSAEGFRPALRRVHRAWILRNLPKSPFIFTVQTGKSQHTIWRAPVSMSPDVLLIRLGEQIMRARMSLLRQAADETRAIVWPAVQEMEQAHLDSDAAAKAGKPGRKPNARKMAKAINVNSTPFTCDSIRFQRVAGGSLRWQVAQALEEGFLKPEAVPAVFQLNAAEAWLMDAMLNEEAEEPPLITDFAIAR